MNTYKLFNYDYLNKDQLEIITLAVDKVRKVTGFAIDDEPFFAIPHTNSIRLYKIGNEYKVLTEIAVIIASDKIIDIHFGNEYYIVIKKPSKKLLYNAFHI